MDDALITDELSRFVGAFRKAIAGEMTAMKARLGPFEVPLGPSPRLTSPDDQAPWRYRFSLPQPNDKLVLDGECTLRHGRGECLVRISALEAGEIELRCDQRIPAGLPEYTLIIYPWFLYERLQQALEEIGEQPGHYEVRRALMLFGKGTPLSTPMPCLDPPAGLNASQQAAVRLCAEQELAFVWGPPGTGKTTTLACVVADLLARGLRVLVTSTTNAAVDQALAELAALDGMAPHFSANAVVRVGQIGAPTYGAGLSEITANMRDERTASTTRVNHRLRSARERLRACEKAMAKVDGSTGPSQGDLFVDAEASSLTMYDLTPVFSTTQARRLVGMDGPGALRRLRRRIARLGQLIGAGERARDRLANELHAEQKEIVRRAGVVLATMTNVYINDLLRRERFDVVLVEEAGMAILPTLFYCAALATKKTLMVGDPRQLPPIVQSRERYVRRTMGRSIFEVTVPDPHASPLVAMLEEQYRMHPVIGGLVSRLYYEGRLRNAPATNERDTIAASTPFSGAPLVVVDSADKAQCAVVAGGYSRYNDVTARYCAALALEARASGLASVAIITPYAEQARRLRSLLQDADGIACHTVHRFQGSERDMVILDTVDTAPHRPGVLLGGTGPEAQAANLLNVGVSRARGKLVIVADVAFFQSRAPGSAVTRLLHEAMAHGKTVRLTED